MVVVDLPRPPRRCMLLVVMWLALIIGCEAGPLIHGTTLPSIYDHGVTRLRESDDAALIEASELEQLEVLSPEAMLVAAEKYATNEDHFRVYVVFKLMSELYPQYAMGFANAGIALEKLGRTQDAFDIYAHMLHLFRADEPSRAYGLLLYATLMKRVASEYFAAEKYEMAARLYQDAIKIAPEDSLDTIYVDLSSALIKLHRYDDALESALNAFKSLGPDQTPSAVLLSRLCSFALHEPRPCNIA